MNHVKVTVIIPVYNCECYLEQCLDSILNQTVREIEVICINDCSQDNSAQILDVYANRDKRIQVIHNERNKGAGACRNLGIRNAVGKYISFVDSDDFCELDMLEKLYKQCEQNQLDICLCNYIQFEEPGQRLVEKKVPWQIHNRIAGGVFTWKDLRKYIFNSWLWVPWNRMYKRSFIRKEAIFFSEIENSEDIYFNSIAMALAGRIGAIEDCSYFYRVNIRTQLSKNLSSGIYCTAMELEKLRKQLVDRGIFEQVAQSFYNCALIAIHHSIVNVSEEKQRELYDYYQREGFLRLKMPIERQEMFYNLTVYQKIRHIAMHPYTGYHCFYKVYSFSEQYRFYEKRIRIFFDELPDSAVVVLWGAAQRGMDFCQSIGENSNKIYSFIDRDEQKWNTKVAEKAVYSYEQIAEKVDWVIVLNTQYFNEICEEIRRKSNKKIKVFDMESYLRMGFDVEECFCKIN